jgi:outer membrane lipoprotein-sorting protein
MMKRLLCALALVAFSVAPALADPKSDVTGAMVTLESAKSYHVTVNSHGQTGDIDMVKPDKMHVVFGPMEMIKIANTSYMKMNGSWQRFAIPGVSERLTGMYEGVLKNATSHVDDLIVTDLGNKVVDGVPLHGYTLKNKDSTVAPSTVYLDGKGMPVRMDTNENTVVHFSKINEPIAIDAPM